MNSIKLPQIRKCSYCLNIKNISEFGFRKRNNKQYLSIYCKKCVNLKSQILRKNNPLINKTYNNSEKAKLAKKKYLENNKDKRKQYEKQYYINNIEKFKKYSKTINFKESKRKYKKNKLSKDSEFKLKCNISNAIFKAFKKGKTNKAGKSILNYLGYSIQDLKQHLEKLFDAKMTWENYGSYWHLDHIIPHSEFKYQSMEDALFKECWSLKNLRPLEAKQNILDGARRTRHKKT